MSEPISGFVPLTLYRDDRELQVLTWVSLGTRASTEAETSEADLASPVPEARQLIDWGDSIVVGTGEVISWREVSALYEAEGTSFEDENATEILRYYTESGLLAEEELPLGPGVRKTTPIERGSRVRDTG